MASVASHRKAPGRGPVGASWGQICLDKINEILRIGDGGGICPKPYDFSHLTPCFRLPGTVYSALASAPACLASTGRISAFDRSAEAPYKVALARSEMPRSFGGRSGGVFCLALSWEGGANAVPRGQALCHCESGREAWAAVRSNYTGARASLDAAWPRAGACFGARKFGIPCVCLCTGSLNLRV